jgi:hypothetical protein
VKLCFTSVMGFPFPKTYPDFSGISEKSLWRIELQELVHLRQIPLAGHIPARFPPANQGLSGPAEQDAQGLLV